MQAVRTTRNGLLGKLIVISRRGVEGLEMRAGTLPPSIFPAKNLKTGELCCIYYPYIQNSKTERISPQRG
jgi:hypothetical protein